MQQQGLTPLKVAINPLNESYRVPICTPPNCYTENVMEGVYGPAPAPAPGPEASVQSGGAGASLSWGPMMGVVLGAVAVTFQ